MALLPRVVLAAFLMVPVMSVAKGPSSIPVRPDPPKTPTELARERVSAWLIMYASHHPRLHKEPAAKLLACVRNKGRTWTERGVALGLLALASVPSTELPAVLHAIVQDEGDSDYLRLDAALALALLGLKEPGAVVILRRVIAPKSFFAITQSNMERGAACLGLALFGDAASRPQIREVSRFPINGIGDDAALALQVMGPVPPGQ